MCETEVSVESGLNYLPPYVKIQLYDEHSRRRQTGLWVKYDGSVFMCAHILVVFEAGFVFRKELVLDV